MNIVEEYISTSKQKDMEFRYSYRLTNKEFNGIAAYGIEIERKDYIGIKNVNLERDSIDLVSSQRHKVKQILMTLYNNEVSPIHLVDIVGTYADEHAYEFDTDVRREAIN